MDQTIIINGSHRAPLSNSRRYTKYLMKFLKTDSTELLLNKNNYDEISKELFSAQTAILVFPLYVDCIPSILLGFLNRLEKLGEKYKSRPTVYIIINCGFIENEQNEVAISIIKFFLKKNGFKYGGVLSIGSGEAILDSPFRGMVRGKIKKMAQAIEHGETICIKTQMPISKWFFVQAGNKYWEIKGSSHGKTKIEMKTMEIK
ncbi:MAG: hypothetical protein JJE49_05230 [Peptostreptococcaceae bacterium]|nr:hypothetical protein [Peptostreptococcaceae bacterium]